VLDPRKWEAVSHALDACNQAAETTHRRAGTTCHDMCAFRRLVDRLRGIGQSVPINSPDSRVSR
jgi:hypothetical protein